jgi:hypothetical protein
LRKALENTARVATTEHKKFQELWEDDDTRQHIRAENSGLGELVERADAIKQLIWEGRLKPLSWREHVPFVRRERYRRLATILSELESEFDEVNERAKIALTALDSTIAAYKDQIDQWRPEANQPTPKQN